jgi:RNA polymerase sigma-70 factor (ECF subfamily)
MTAMDDRVPPPVPAIRSRSTPFELHVLPEIEVLYRVARSLTRHPADAEDLVQDTLLRAHRSIATFDGRHPRAWLLTIMRNAHLNRIRRPRPELMHDPGDAALTPSASVDAPDGFVDQALDTEVARALDDLPAKFRQVIEIVDMEGRSYATAAEVLGVPVGTVMSRLHRARARIRAHLLHAGVAPRSPG